MGHILPTKKNNVMSPLILLDEAANYCHSNLGVNVTPLISNILLKLYLLPVFESGGKSYILRNDLIDLMNIIIHFSQANLMPFHGATLFDPGIPSNLCPVTGTYVTLTHDLNKIDPTFFSAIRNLVASANLLNTDLMEVPSIYSYFFPTTITTASRSLVSYVQDQLSRAKSVEGSKANQFSGSAYYMGAKRHLATFLVEAIANVLPDHGTVIDLMCGSGAASAAFNRVWRTLASDAQTFCRILALSQGGGFSFQWAQTVINQLLPVARKHADDLSSLLGGFVAWEERIIHGSAASDVTEEYSRFVASLPTYPHDKDSHGWDPVREVVLRKHFPSLYPWCLFTAYFANVYFGLRQCIEIDSLRYAISTLTSTDEQNWAMAALIASLSAQGSTYAAHFAQPLIKPLVDNDASTVQRMLQKRAPSIMHEFTVRLLNLARESEGITRPIYDLPGPWTNALDNAIQRVGNEPVVVYIDAPYTRDEYSRYYHVLETLVTYNYPSAIGKGKLPNKEAGERFRSEFFTKSRQQVSRSFVRLISTILERDWICAWSYSNTGNADIIYTIDDVFRLTNSEIYSYAVPYEYKAQGGHGQKKVTEYLIIFRP